MQALFSKKLAFPDDACYNLTGGAMTISIGGRRDVKALRRQYAHLRGHIKPRRNTYLVLAESGGAVAGFAFVKRRGHEDFIYVIEVPDPANRSQGIGSALVAAVIACARKNGSCRVRAYFDGENAASRGLWLKNGFELTPEGPGYFAAYPL